MILVSACLLNHPVRYKGDGNPCPILLEALAKGHGEQLLPFCPEVAGGLPTPRLPAEIKDGTGADVPWRCDWKDNHSHRRAGAFFAYVVKRKARSTSFSLAD